MSKDGEHNQKNPTDNVIDETTSPAVSKSVKSIKSLKSIRSPSDKRHQTRTRRVKFAEPIIHLRLYDRTASPNAETEVVKNPKINPTALDQLGPPLSLVAHLDMAAKKLNARGPQSTAHKVHRDGPTSPQSPHSPPQRTSSSPTTTTTTTTTTLTAVASKTQFPKRDQHQQLELSNEGPTSDPRAMKSSKTMLKPQLKSEPKNEPKNDNRRM
jgi:hypothetical protein